MKWTEALGDLRCKQRTDRQTADTRWLQSEAIRQLDEHADRSLRGQTAGSSLRSQAKGPAFLHHTKLYLKMSLTSRVQVLTLLTLLTTERFHSHLVP